MSPGPAHSPFGLLHAEVQLWCWLKGHLISILHSPFTGIWVCICWSLSFQCCEFPPWNPGIYICCCLWGWPVTVRFHAEQLHHWANLASPKNRSVQRQMSEHTV